VKIPIGNESQLSKAVDKAFQELISTKHLYQSVTVDFESCIQEQAREEFIRRNRGDLPNEGETEETNRARILADLDAKDWAFDGSKVGNPLSAAAFPPVHLLCSG
jgi:hypothetical protein